MTVIIDGREYSAETATGLINEIKGMHWQAGADTTPEEYIAMQERTYRKMMRRRMGTRKPEPRRCSKLWQTQERGFTRRAETMKKRYYFAYGSNCNLGQMAHRCPDATLVGRVTLQNYRLTFNGRGMMRSGGVASVRRHNGRYVPGLLWEITPECERSLDRYEGYPHLYGKKIGRAHV